LAKHKTVHNCINLCEINTIPAKGALLQILNHKQMQKIIVMIVPSKQ